MYEYISTSTQITRAGQFCYRELIINQIYLDDTIYYVVNLCKFYQIKFRSLGNCGLSQVISDIR